MSTTTKMTLKRCVCPDGILKPLPCVNMTTSHLQCEIRPKTQDTESNTANKHIHRTEIETQQKKQRRYVYQACNFLLFLEVKQPSGFQQDPHLRTLVRVWISSSWAKTTPSTNTRTSCAEKCVSVCLLCDFYASLSVWETSKPKLSAFSLWQVSLSKRLNAFPIHEKKWKVLFVVVKLYL